MRATQRYDRVVISGLAHVDAPDVVTSAEIEARIAGTLERLGGDSQWSTVVKLSPTDRMGS